VRTDLLTGKVASYSLGDKNITLQNMADLDLIIQRLEAVVVSAESGPILPFMGGAANAPGPGSGGFLNTCEWSQ
jgi:hypothetical protein